ncbi:hypothetical protein ACXET9_05565 [Brachybacterium sp. DNPG3]
MAVPNPPGGGAEASRSPSGLVVRILGAVLAGGAALLWLLLAAMVASSILGSGASDPHGFAAIGATLLSLPVGVAGAVALALAAPPGRRGAVLALALILVLIGGGALLALLSLG